MKPPPFQYHRPSSVGAALALLAEHQDEAKVLAGGQSLIPLLSMRLAAPNRLIDINSLSELGYVRAEPGGVRIGALARHTDVLQRAEHPMLAETLPNIAHATIRNRGTSVGSIVHADPAAELPAVLSLLDGSVTVRSTRGERVIAAGQLFAGPLESTIGPDELATSAFFPIPAGRCGTAFLELARRHGDYALCGVAISVTLDDDLHIAAARAGYLSMAGTPVVLDLTAAIAGRGYDTDLSAAGDLAADRLAPEPDLHASAEYRRQLARTLTARAASRAARRAAEGPVAA